MSGNERNFLMTAPLDELYQAIILEHANHPRHYGKLPAPALCVEGYNPLCGDQVGACAVLQEGVFLKVNCFGEGCAISKASASLMAEALQGKSAAEFEALFCLLQSALTGDEVAVRTLEAHGELAALAGVRHFPARVKCAMLGWQALREVVHGKSGKLDV